MIVPMRRIIYREALTQRGLLVRVMSLVLEYRFQTMEKP